MATLYKRASPQQKKLIRCIEGAIRDAMNCHSEIVLSEKNIRSITKRAVGTLSPLLEGASGSANKQMSA
jgi:hypothetical protein